MVARRRTEAGSQRWLLAISVAFAMLGALFAGAAWLIFAGNPKWSGADLLSPIVSRQQSAVGWAPYLGPPTSGSGGYDPRTSTASRAAKSPARHNTGSPGRRCGQGESPWDQ